MSALIYKLINPPIRLLLKSPFHPILSSNTLLLAFTGRKTGRALSTPISYYKADGMVHCFTNKSFGWWRNLLSMKEVGLTIAGRDYKSEAMVESEDEAKLAEALVKFLIAVPRDAAHAAVRMVDGQPELSDIRRAVRGMVHLSFPIDH